MVGVGFFLKIKLFNAIPLPLPLPLGGCQKLGNESKNTKKLSFTQPVYIFYCKGNVGVSSKFILLDEGKVHFIPLILYSKIYSLFRFHVLENLF